MNMDLFTGKMLCELGKLQKKYLKNTMKQAAIDAPLPLLCMRADLFQRQYANISMDKGKSATSKTGTIQKSIIS